MEELLIVSDNCDGVGVMNKRGTWWYLCFRKSRRMGGCVAGNAVHIKYSWTALHFPAFCEIRSVPQNGVLAKWIWAEICKILLGLTVLKSSMSSSSVKSMEATCFRGCRRWKKSAWHVSEDGSSENAYLLHQVTHFPGLIPCCSRALLSWLAQGTGLETEPS